MSTSCRCCSRAACSMAEVFPTPGAVPTKTVSRHPSARACAGRASDAGWPSSSDRCHATPCPLSAQRTVQRPPHPRLGEDGRRVDPPDADRYDVHHPSDGNDAAGDAPESRDRTIRARFQTLRAWPPPRRIQMTRMPTPMGAALVPRACRRFYGALTLRWQARPCSVKQASVQSATGPSLRTGTLVSIGPTMARARDGPRAAAIVRG